MIRPPGRAEGAAFSEAADGDLRGEVRARAAFSAALGIGPDWATVEQVHGAEVHRVDTSGSAGRGDAVWTTEPGLPVAVFTADCFGVVVTSRSAVGVAHAGWRGARSGVVSALVTAMAGEGHVVDTAFVGPGIGPCCFEVGPDVAAGFPGEPAMTSWGTPSVDLARSIRSQLGGIPVWSVGGCTRHEPGWFSHRRDGTSRRMASLAWI